MLGFQKVKHHHSSFSGVNWYLISFYRYLCNAQIAGGGHIHVFYHGVGPLILRSKKGKDPTLQLLIFLLPPKWCTEQNISYLNLFLPLSEKSLMVLQRFMLVRWLPAFGCKYKQNAAVCSCRTIWLNLFLRVVPQCIKAIKLDEQNGGKSRFRDLCLNKGQVCWACQSCITFQTV